ncbi:MAG: hypothetical protein WD669_07670 [Pirellulales bacterium]
MTRQFSIPRAVAAMLGVVAILTSFSVRLSADDEALPKSPPAEAGSPVVDRIMYELRYKCSLGDVWRYEVSHKAAIRSTIDQSTQSAQTRTDSVKSWKITDILPEGAIEFMTVVEKVHMVNQLPDKDPTEYNSERDKTPPPGFEDAARSVGVPLSVVRMSPQGKVLRRELKIKRPGAEDDGPLVVLLPEQPVAIGDSWDEPFDLTVQLKTGGTKAIQSRRHYKLAKVENGIATISVDYQVLTPIDAHIESQIVQRLMDGEVRFDIEAGRVVGQKMEIDKRILGFAGPTSSMQYIVRMEEKLLFAPHKIVVKPADKPVTKPTPPSNPTRTATRPSTTPPGRTMRRR